MIPVSPSQNDSVKMFSNRTGLLVASSDAHWCWQQASSQASLPTVLLLYPLWTRCIHTTHVLFWDELQERGGQECVPQSLFALSNRPIASFELEKLNLQVYFWRDCADGNEQAGNLSGIMHVGTSSCHLGPASSELQKRLSFNVQVKPDLLIKTITDAWNNQYYLQIIISRNMIWWWIDEYDKHIEIISPGEGSS